jgi:hypothetical protein
MEGQREWASHASFMNGLEAESFVLVAGPLETTPNVLLLVQAEDESEIRSRLEADPWSRGALLNLKEVAPWTLRLGSLGPTLTPTVSYDDAARGIHWLTDVLGFAVGAKFQGPDGRVVFAQLHWRTDVAFVSLRAPAGNPWANVGPASIALAVESRTATTGAPSPRAPRSSGHSITPERPSFPTAATSSTCGTRKATSGRSARSDFALPAAREKKGEGRDPSPQR